MLFAKITSDEFYAYLETLNAVVHYLSPSMKKNLHLLREHIHTPKGFTEEQLIIVFSLS